MTRPQIKYLLSFQLLLVQLSIWAQTAAELPAMARGTVQALLVSEQYSQLRILYDRKLRAEDSSWQRSFEARRMKITLDYMYHAAESANWKMTDGSPRVTMQSKLFLDIYGPADTNNVGLMDYYSGELANALLREANSEKRLPGINLSPAIIEIVNKGIETARLGNPVQAVSFFEQALRSQASTLMYFDPGSALIYYDLGITESKIPGRELRAISWLAASLCMPDCPADRKELVKLILALEKKDKDRLFNKCRNLRDAALSFTGSQRSPYLFKAITFFARAGYTDDAGMLVDMIKIDSLRNLSRKEIAKAFLRAGLIEDAQNTSTRITDLALKAELMEAITAAKQMKEDTLAAKIFTRYTRGDTGKEYEGPFIKRNSGEPSYAGDWLRNFYPYNHDSEILPIDLNDKLLVDPVTYFRTGLDSIEHLVDKDPDLRYLRYADQESMFDFLCNTVDMSIRAHRVIADLLKRTIDDYPGN